jgi:translation elongation factor EF-Tu-like GTPase
MAFWNRRRDPDADNPLHYDPAATLAPTGGGLGAVPVAGGSFSMPVQDVFTISGRGTVVTGKVERGTVTVGDALEVVDASGGVIATSCSGVEKFRSKLDSASVGDNVGLLLTGVDKGQVAAGSTVRSATR